MKIELSYNYSTLYERHEFGLISEGVEEQYYRWVWYYLGSIFGNDKRLYLRPWETSFSKIIGKYKAYVSSEKQAQLIANKINKIIQHENENQIPD